MIFVCQNSLLASISSCESVKKQVTFLDIRLRLEVLYEYGSMEKKRGFRYEKDSIGIYEGVAL